MAAAVDFGCALEGDNGVGGMLRGDAGGWLEHGGCAGGTVKVEGKNG